MSDGINPHVGINYMRITNGCKDKQFMVADACNNATEPVLRELFANASMPLKPGVNVINCTTEDLMGRYDLKEGIDMVVYTEDGTRHTLQQKTLHTSFRTCTFEETKWTIVEDSLTEVKGAWYYCTAQFYYVVYTNESQEELRRQLTQNQFTPTIREGILINLPKIHELSKQGLIKWKYRHNAKYRSNSFRFFMIDETPNECLVSHKIYEPEMELPF